MEISRKSWNHCIVLLGILSIAGLSSGRPQQQVEDPLKRDVPVLTDPKPHLSRQNDNRYIRDVRNNFTLSKNESSIPLGIFKTNAKNFTLGGRKTRTSPHSNVNNRHENNRSSPDKNRKTVMSFLAELPLEIVERPVLIEDHIYEGVSKALDDRLNYTDIINDAINRRVGRKVTRRNHNMQLENTSSDANIEHIKHNFRDRSIYKNFLRRATADLTSERLRKRKLPDRKKNPPSALKHWPDTALSTQDEFDSYENYTKIVEDDGFDNDRNGIQHMAVSTSQKKPVIHQVLTKWSDTPSYDDFDTLHTTQPTNDVKDVVTFNEFSDDNVRPTTFSDNLMGGVSSIEPYVDFYSNGQNVDSSKIYDRPVDEPTVYIRPKPVYTSSINQNDNEDSLTFHPSPRPPIGTQDLFNRPLTTPKPAQNNYIVSNGPPTIVLSTKPGYHDKHPIQVVAPSNTNSKPNIVNVGPNRPDLADDNVFFPSGKPVTPIPIGDDGCPLVYITLNNTVQNKAKEGCADIHLVINSNVLNNNGVVDDSEGQIGSNAYPIAGSADSPDYDPVNEEGNVYAAGDIPVVEGVNSQVPIEPVFSSAVSSDSAAAESSASGTVSNSLIPSSISLPQFGGLGGSGGAGGAGGGGGGSRPNDDDDEGGGLMSYFSSAMDTFTYMSLMNPFNYGIFSFLLAPLVIFAAGGAGLVSLLMPWTWSGVLERNAKNDVRPLSNWKWNPDYKSWNWAGFPNSQKVEKNENSVQVSPHRQGLKDIVYKIYGNIRKWAYSKYRKLFDARNKSRSIRKSISIDENKKENWKKRRK